MSGTRTPSETTVRAGWAKGHPFPRATEVDERYAEFDRFIANVKAEAWGEGYNAGYDCGEATYIQGYDSEVVAPRNPYRGGDAT